MVSGFGDFHTTFLDSIYLLGTGCGYYSFPSECASVGSAVYNIWNMQVKILYGQISLLPVDTEYDSLVLNCCLLVVLLFVLVLMVFALPKADHSFCLWQLTVLCLVHIKI